jgi:excisionase family DNA binding protein
MMRTRAIATIGEVMTVKDLSDYLQCNQSTIYRLLKRGELPAFKVGSDWRFMTDEIRTWCKRKMARPRGRGPMDRPEA